MPNFHIFDTYAKTSNGKIIHFDVILEEQNQQHAIEYAQQWLQSIGINNATISSGNCFFCHSVTELPNDLTQEMANQGYAIYKLEGCPQ